MDGQYILVDGKPVKEPSPLKWGTWMQSGNRRVADDHFEGFRVSTVFLGLDHRSHGGGTPLLYETMVFCKGSDLEQDMERYATRDEALAGHKIIVADLKAKATSETE